MFDRFRIFAAYLFAIPLALILGVMAAAPGELTIMLVGMLLFFLALPIAIKWHHAWMIFFWNSAFCAFFLPGQPSFWLFFAALSFTMSVLNRFMGRKPFLSVPEMTRPLLVFGAIVVATAFYRGGIGFKSIGGAGNGGKFYVYVLGAIVGYFALTAGQIPASKARGMTALFFLSGTSFVFSNLAYVLGPSFFFIYYFIPSSAAMAQAATDFGVTNIMRIEGLSETCVAILCYLLAAYGIRGLFAISKPWRFLILLTTIGLSFFAGFRSILAILSLIFAFQFYFEGLLRTRLFPILVGLIICGVVTTALFADKLPLAVQRTISFLPVNVDSSVRDDAVGSTDWRLQMWSIVWKEVPNYLIIGKGYAIDPTDMYLTQQAIHMGLISNFEEALLAGDYHNGPLSVLVPFGIAGSLAFLWVLFSGGRILLLNYRHGDPQLQGINTLLLSYYLATCVSFFFIFGSLYSQLYIFLGVVGLSLSLNEGVKRKSAFEPDHVHSGLQPAYAVELK